MRFKNRDEAAQKLAGRLAAYKGHTPLILGVPRGAVPMARTIADALEGQLDVVLVRKLRAPGQPELAIGAVDEAGTVLKGTYFDVADEEHLRKEIRAQQEVIRARRMYTRAQRVIDPAGRTVVIVDDGNGCCCRAVGPWNVAHREHVIFGYRHLNRQAMRQMHAHVELEIVPGATHRFEEPGTLDRAAELAAGWFARYLRPGVAERERQGRSDSTDATR